MSENEVAENEEVVSQQEQAPEHGLVSQFFATLPDTLSVLEQTRLCRRMKDGFFLSETLLDTVLPRITCGSMRYTKCFSGIIFNSERYEGLFVLYVSLNVNWG